MKQSHNRVKLWMLGFLILNTSSYVSGQTLRNPTPAEKAAIDKFVHAVEPLVKPYADSNWEFKDGGPEDPDNYSVQVKPDVVMGVAPFTDYEFDMIQGTALWNKEMKPIMDSVMNLSSYGFSPEEMGLANDRLAERSDNTSIVYVSIIPNTGGLSLNPLKGNKRDLKIPGCYYSYFLSDDNDGLADGLHGDQKYRFVLVFGDWSGTKLTNTDPNFYRFPFKHPNNSPFIENAIIVLCGNKERIKELVKQTNWKKVNAGLTK